MEFQNPIRIYNAASNHQADLIKNALASEGIEAHVSEDNSVYSRWVGGFNSCLIRAQIWVDGNQAELAKNVIQKFEQLNSPKELPSQTDGALIEIICPQCQTHAVFPGELLGTVQECRKCGAFLDVGDDEPFDDWKTSEPDPET